MAREVKCVVVGDEDVGKSTLLKSFWNCKAKTCTAPPPVSEKTEEYTKEVRLDGNLFNVTLKESSPEARFRPISYSEANIFLLCFSVVCPTTLENVKEYWVPELRRYSPSTPIILVGTKTDLRHSARTVSKLVENGHQPVYEKAGMQLAQKVGAVAYVECCGLETEEVSKVMNESVRHARDVGEKEEKRSSRKEKCTIM